jgi:DNA-binding MarR family transcriptional regulator
VTDQAERALRADDTLVVALASVAQQVAARMRGLLAGVGLSPRRFLALQLLAGAGSMGQQSLVEALGVDPSVLVAVLNDLEAAGLAERRRDPGDRRRHIVDISPAGVELLGRVRRSIETVERDLLADLDDGEVSHLHGVLARLRIPASADSCSDEPSG